MKLTLSRSISKIKESEDKISNIKYGNDLITIKLVDLEPSTISLMTKWRKRYVDYFGTKFIPTYERTKKWIKEQLIDNDKRILFLIVLNKKKIGHIGLASFDDRKKCAEIDSVLKGENTNHKIMELALREILKFGFNDLRLDSIWLKVFSDNYKALNLYERCGMLTIDSIPIKRVYTNDGWIWKETALKKNEFPERFYNVLEITKKRFVGTNTHG